MNEKRLAFRVLRSYVKEICGDKIDDINTDLAQEISKRTERKSNKKSKIGVKTIENIAYGGKNGRQCFTGDEPRIVAEYFATIAKDKDEIKILRPLLEYFLTVHDSFGDSDIKRIVCDLLEEENDSSSANSVTESNSHTSNEGRFQIVFGNEVTEADIEDAIDLDSISYEEKYRGKKETCIAWAQANPNIYVMLRDRRSQKIVAYINAMPITEDCYEMIKRGSFSDVDIPPENILSYELPYEYCLYLASIVIHPDFRAQGALSYLLKALVDLFLALGTKGVFIKNLIADAVSIEGKKFCNLFGMKEIAATDRNSPLYEVSMLPPEFNAKWSVFKRLRTFYQNEYEKKEKDESKQSPYK